MAASSLLCTARQLSKPLLDKVFLTTTSTIPQRLCHRGTCETHLIKWPHARHLLVKKWTCSRYAALMSSLYVQPIQQCYYGTTNSEQKTHGAAGQSTKSKPDRTLDDEKLSEEKQVVDDRYGDEADMVDSDDSKSKPQFVHRYKKAREKMQETRERVQEKFEMKENIFTIPNYLTISRILLSPVLGYLVIHEYHTLAASLFLVTSATDVLDGWIARNFANQQSVLGSIIDPLADKILITVLTLSLTISGLIPGLLTFIIIGRDVMLITGVFWLRYKSLPEPKTLAKYFDITHTTVKLQPTTISKYNTLIQVGLVGVTIGAPVLNYVDHPLLQALWFVTATSTVLSGLSYIYYFKDTFNLGLVHTLIRSIHHQTM